MLFKKRSTDFDDFITQSLSLLSTSALRGGLSDNSRSTQRGYSTVRQTRKSYKGVLKFITNSLRGIRMTTYTTPYGITERYSVGSFKVEVSRDDTERRVCVKVSRPVRVTRRK